jgi:RNA-binding protein
MDKEIKRHLSKANLLDPVMAIGKNGITENVIKALKEHLKNKKLIKVKILKNFIQGKDKKDIFNEIAEKTDSNIVHKVGFTVTLYKKEEKNA